MSKKVSLITIDGPAASGKTTVAKLLAERLNYKLLESGALYRLVTYCVIEKKMFEKVLSKEVDIISFLKEVFNEVEVRLGSKGTQILWKGKKIDKELRFKEVEDKVSFIAAIPEVREFLTTYMRNLVDKDRIIAEGRDMGSVVFKDADLKIFLTADEKIRVQRRYKDHVGSLSLEEAKKNVVLRDELDSKRKVAPLKIPNDAYVIDTSELTPEEVVDKILEKIKTYEKGVV